MFGISLNPIDWVTDAAGSVIGGAGDAVLDALVARVEEALAYVSRAVDRVTRAEGLSSGWI